MLEGFRREIDAIDEELMRLLGQRFDVCRRVGECKRQNDIPIVQPDRDEQIRRRCREGAERYGLDPEFMVELYCLIVSATCRLEDEIVDGSDEV